MKRKRKRSYLVIWAPRVHKYTEQKKERNNFGGVTFLNSRWKWIYGMWILLIALFYIELCNKFRDPSSVKRLSGQWVEFQKSPCWTNINHVNQHVVDGRYLYLFPDRTITNSWKNPYWLERKSVQKMVGLIVNGCRKRKTRTILFYLSLTGNFTTQGGDGGFLQYSRWQKYRLEIPKHQMKNPSKNDFLWFVLCGKFVAFFRNFGLRVYRTLSFTFNVQKFPNHGIHGKPKHMPLDRRCNDAH